MSIVGNSSLRELSAFPALKRIGLGFEISQTRLKDISGFGSLTQVGNAGGVANRDFKISDNISLNTINGFGSLTSVNGSFSLISNSSWGLDLTAFGSLESVGELHIQNNRLHHLNNFRSLTNLGNGSLIIEGNSYLSNISGLENVNPATIGGRAGLYIANNTALDVCNLPNFCTYLNGSGARTISGNKTTCLDEAAVVAACEAALPVTLVDFSATPDEQSVLLEWHTTSESNASHYEIQRSADGRLWQEIGAIAAAGESDAPLAYRHRDLRPLPGLSYYRLKMIDHTGGHGDAGFAYSEIRSVVRAERMDTALKLYPNPVTDRVYLETEGVITEVLLWDIAGRLVRKERYQEGIGISIDGLGLGILLVEARLADGTSRMGRVVVQPNR